MYGPLKNITLLRSETEFLHGNKVQCATVRCLSFYKPWFVRNSRKWNDLFTLKTSWIIFKVITRLEHLKITCVWYLLIMLKTWLKWKTVPQTNRSREQSRRSKQNKHELSKQTHFTAEDSSKFSSKWWNLRKWWLVEAMMVMR